MGKFKRIPVDDLKAVGKTLDSLPDKNLGKTREEAVDMLNAQIVRALEKGYSIREITEIMAGGNVSIPPSVIRAKIVALKATATQKSEPKAGKAKKAADTPPPPAHKTVQDAEIPAYYTADLPDSEL